MVPSEGVPTDVYVVLRVYHLQKEGTPPKFAAYVDPWTMYLEDKLRFMAVDKYVVTPS